MDHSQSTSRFQEVVSGNAWIGNTVLKGSELGGTEYRL